MGKKRTADLGDLLVQFKIANRLLAAQLKDRLQQHEIIALLASSGASNQEIAATINTTAGVVAVTMNRNKRKKGGK